jgi:hypothetical protein
VKHDTLGGGRGHVLNARGLAAKKKALAERHLPRLMRILHPIVEPKADLLPIGPPISFIAAV